MSLMVSEGPMGPATALLSEIRSELYLLTTYINELLEETRREREAPHVEVLPAPVVVEGKEVQPVDLSPLLDAIRSLALFRPDDSSVAEELRALRSDFDTYQTVMRNIIGSVGGGARGIGASVVTAGGDFPVMNAAGETFRATVTDKFTSGEILPDQTGAGAVLTFTFSQPVSMIWVRADGGDVRVDPFGGTPAASTGIIAEDGVPLPVTVEANAVKVYAPAGTSVSVHGYRY